MNRKRNIFALTTLVFVLTILPIEMYAQSKKGPKKAWPDSLSTVTLTGTVLIDSAKHSIYFLDVDADSLADYQLAFGPDWYVPESGAERPAAGEHVTIMGTVKSRSKLPVLIVFEINGLVWRDAVENWWNRREACDSLEIITATGTILLDTTYFYEHYFLDTDNDQNADYGLSFGPPWYEPASGATRPSDGEVVTIEGALKENSQIDRLIVLKINDLVWREPQGPAPWRGRWLGKDKNNSFKHYCPYDSLSWFEIPPGALKGNGQNGTKFADSTFCELWKVWRDSLPGYVDSLVAGWHFYFANPAGQRVNGKGKAVRFIKRIRVHLSAFQDSSGANLLAKFTADELKLKYWDENLEEWMPVEAAKVNSNNHSVTLDTESLQSYYAFFTSEGTSDVIQLPFQKPVDVVLEQNYPNPFNPETSIRFQTNVRAQVVLTIFNLLGQEVRTLVNELKPAGTYQLVWDGRDNQGNLMNSGTYFYRLIVGEQSQIKRLVFMK